MARDDSAIGITAWGGGAERGDGADCLNVTESIKASLLQSISL